MDAQDAFIAKEILDLLEETFEKVEGYFLDRGTSFLETLEGIDAREASAKRAGFPETVAGHVYHVIFYIRILQEYITDLRSGKTDWRESWTVAEVDEAGWDSLRADLRGEYSALREFVGGVEGWTGGDYLGGVIGIIAHTAYHLGAVRQLMEVPV